MMWNFLNVLFLSILVINMKSSKSIGDTAKSKIQYNLFPVSELTVPKAFQLHGYEKKETNNSNVCRFREILFHKSYWNWKVGAECYSYNPKDWFTEKLRITSQPITIENVTYRVPFGLTHDNEPFGFDYNDAKSSKIIAASFKNDMLFRKWENCAIAGEACCRDKMNEENIFPTPWYPCPATWDAWSCFPPAKEDSISELPCPDYTSSSNDTPCILYSQKECFSNGTWNQQTDYSTCATAPVYRKRHTFHITVLYVSIALSFPAVVIFISYRSLRILRVNLHRNLLIACILRNILTIVSKEVVILDSLKSSSESKDVLVDNGVGCRMLAYFTSVAANAIYACMLMDGFYLHKLIVRIFSADPNVYMMYGVTVVLSLLPTTIWSILVAIEADEYCWMVDNSWYQWIPDGFRIAILSVNIILLIDIMRALLCKLRQNISAQHTKSTLKAMAFLIPLFGVPFIITANRNIIDNDSCKAGDIFYYVSYSIQALQGIMVAILFCYWNKEVHTQIKGTYRKLNSLYEARFGSKNDNTQAVNRRETAATYVHNNSVIPKNNPFVNNVPHATEDFSNKVKDWLTGNQAENSLDALPMESFKQDSQQAKDSTVGPETSNFNVVNTSRDGFNRISKFIDDSTESVRKLNDSTPKNLQNILARDKEMDELNKSSPNIPNERL